MHYIDTVVQLQAKAGEEMKIIYSPKPNLQHTKSKTYVQ